MNTSGYANASITIVPLDLSKHMDSLPVLTLQAFNIQGLFNILVQSVAAMETAGNGLPDMPGADKDEIEDQVEDCIYSLGEMLKMTQSLLGGMEGDEMGKRKVKTLVQELLVHPYFPNTLLSQSLSLLLKVSDNTLDFIDAIVSSTILWQYC
jgi:condensin complex subunit 3